MSIEETIKQLPKIEQHVHIVGSVRPETLLWLNEQGEIKLPYKTLDDLKDFYAYKGFEPFLVSAAVTGVVSQRLVPRKKGAGRVPVVAVLSPDDRWRDFIAGNPGLAQLRKRIAGHPEADLQASVAEAVKAGLIPATVRI